ncbi:hypothetical protein WME90_20530 [Sorangium sp. So ce375]|uniref:hypothetical protein n=1 Tax=Sorangium sp. So ce375 TaxID=3133306 RepID=UPI003F5B2E1D
MRSTIIAELATNDARTTQEQPEHTPPSDRRTRTRSALVRRVSMAVCLFVAACGGAEDAGDPGPTGGGGAGGSSDPELTGGGGAGGSGAGEPTAWKDMNFEQRVAYMNGTVLPRMKEVFVAYDPAFETMDCTTCHGADGATQDYAMPSPEIAVLPDTEEGFLEYVEDPEHPERAEWSTFMFEKVVPEMASLLQRVQYDPTTGNGDFSCNNCHTLGSVEP